MMDLGDIDLSKVGEILSALSEEDVENLSSMAAEMFGSDALPGTDKKQKQNSSKDKSDGFPFGDMPFDMENMAKVMKLMNKLKNQPEDQRIKLLNTLRPMLSEARRGRVDQVVQILKIMSIIPLLRD